MGTPQWGRRHAPIKPRRPVHIVLLAARRDPATEGHGVVLVAPNNEVWTFNAPEERVELERSPRDGCGACGPRGQTGRHGPRHHGSLDRRREV